jgi:hypothetical protein
MAVVEERPDLALCFASDGAKYHWKVLTAMACQLAGRLHRKLGTTTGTNGLVPVASMEPSR